MTHTQTHRTAIVSTSINPTPNAYREWAKQGDLIVAGDVNSPSDTLGAYLADLGAFYMNPDFQRAYNPQVSDAIGWNCEQRRNLAVLYAYEHGYDFVMTVDDDNSPEHNGVVDELVAVLTDTEFSVTTWSSTTGWLNPGEFSWPTVVQRGMPYNRKWDHYVQDGVRVRPVVAQATILGDPDCCALYRIVNRPNVTGVHLNGGVVNPSVYAPFGSQATMWRGAWSPLIACLPGLGRSQDIYASFVAERLMRTRDVGVYFGQPCVRQERNEHNAYRDVESELWGLENTTEFVSALDVVELDEHAPLWENYHALADGIHENVESLWFRTPSVAQFMHVWAHAWKTARRVRSTWRTA